MWHALPQLILSPAHRLKYALKCPGSSAMARLYSAIAPVKSPLRRSANPLAWCTSASGLIELELLLLEGAAGGSMTDVLRAEEDEAARGAYTVGGAATGIIPPWP